MLYSRLFNTMLLSQYLKQVTKHIIVHFNINSLKLLKNCKMEIEIL